MKSESPCPGCAQPLQPLLVKTSSGAELELGRCPHCGGGWGARGCLQEAGGPSARHQLTGGLTTRSCVECRILLTPAVLPDQLSVEVCSACHGMFLERGVLARLGLGAAPPPLGRAMPPPPPPPDEEDEEPESPRLEIAPPIETAGTFACVECGQRKSLREGQVLRDGLACRACMRARMEGR